MAFLKTMKKMLTMRPCGCTKKKNLYKRRRTIKRGGYDWKHSPMKHSRAHSKHSRAHSKHGDSV